MTPQRVVILRHAEKPAEDGNPHLSAAGQARADMLAQLIPRQFPNPDFLFAAAPSTGSNRCLETLLPLSKALGLPVNGIFADGDFVQLADDLLTRPAYDRKGIIICWHHGKIPELAVALGVQPAQLEGLAGMIGQHWDPAVFDRFWVLDFAPTVGVAFASAVQTSSP